MYVIPYPLLALWLFENYLDKPFTSPMFVSRCKQNYFSYVIWHGVQICGFYLIFTFLLFYGIPTLSGLQITMNRDIIVHFLNLFSFLFTVYLCYLLLLIKTNRQMQSLLEVLGINLFVLMLYHIFGAVDTVLSLVMEDFLIASYPGLAACMLLVIAFTVRRKDWLDDEK